MYVYLLKHEGKRTFKIGKAIDIHGRIPSIGGYDAFDLASSLCVQFPQEADSKRQERVLHRLFHEWNVPPIAGERQDGDTEHFKIECFDRVIRFLEANQDLTGGKIQPIPLRPTDMRDGDTREPLPPEVRRARREQRRLMRQMEDEASNRDSVDGWSTFLDWFSQHRERVLDVTSAGPDTAVEVALSVDDPEAFRQNSSIRKGWCNFTYKGWDEEGSFGYGAISRWGSIRTPTRVGLSLQPANMPIVKRYASAELTAKILAVNAWIDERRRTHSAQP